MRIHKILIFLVIFATSISISIAQGIEFQAITLKEAFEKAQKEQKHVMVMFGSTHCGYTLMAYHKLSKSTEFGSFFDQNFISVAYGHPDGLQATNVMELMESGINADYAIIENNEETVITNYFVFPNFVFFDPTGKVTYVFTGSGKIEKRIVKAAKKGLTPKTQTPFLFWTYFNNKMYPKNKRSLNMLSEAMLAYHQLDVPDNLDYAKTESATWDEFRLSKSNQDLAIQHIEKSLAYGSYYFNHFLAAMIYDKTGDRELAVIHAEKALNNFPKHWSKNKRLLPDELLRINLINID
jgi:thioredoxin-related protein